MRPEHFRDVLGETFVRTTSRTILTLGKRRYDRFRLGEIGIPSMAAAATLDLVLQRLSIKTPEQLAARVSDLTALEGVGLTTFYAALAVLADCEREAAALAEYRAAAASKSGDHAVTFSTMKARERRRQQLHKKQTNPRARRTA